MFSFFRIVTHTKPLDVWQYVQPLRYFSASSIKAKSPWSKDPETRREQYDKYNMLKREKYAHNKAFREKCTKGSRLAKQAMSDFDWLVYRRQNSFYNWVLRGLRSGAVRTWRTHTPEYSLVRETRCCSECGSYHNKRLWWKRKDAYNSYDVRLPLPCTGHRTISSAKFLSLY